jgi:hypothetical protein
MRKNDLPTLLRPVDRFIQFRDDLLHMVAAIGRPIGKIVTGLLLADLRRRRVKAG